MNYLLDTHIFLWAVDDSPKLSAKIRSILEDGSNLIYVSAVTPWEISIKQKLGKLRVSSQPYAYELEAHRFVDLQITSEHAILAGRLPLYHRDPFDRMLVAQAQIERLTLISADARFGAYDVKLIR